MNATIHSLSAAANHKRWQEMEAARVCRDKIEVSEIATREQVNALLGREWCSKVRRHQAKAGTFQAARNLRKRGVGLLMAKLLLLGRV
jgi:hypothetical protein